MGPNIKWLLGGSKYYHMPALLDAPLSTYNMNDLSHQYNPYTIARSPTVTQL